jgi:glutamate-1-semialdehyde 2,1-aminomutase
MKSTEKSSRFYKYAQRTIPGGVNSPVRACKSVGAEPLFIKSAEGAVIVDADGNRYIDYIGSWGPMILGHRHPAVLSAIRKALGRGTSFGAPTDLEIELAEMVADAVPSVDMIRMVNSGTEAAMSAIRLARGYTQRDLVLKFDGCYHGHADSLLVAAGSGVATLAIPGSPGVPERAAKDTLSLPYNNIERFQLVMQARGDDVACVIVEPVAGNMGLVPPVPGFLKNLRELTTRYGALLIFDEVMTGFRVAYGGAQALYKIKPDLSCFGKIIGGGLPVGAYGGRRKVMNHVAPLGPVYQAGTLSGNPLAMAAGIATLKQLKKKGFYEKLEKKTARLEAGLAKAAATAGIPVQTAHVGSMLGMFFCAAPVKSYDGARKSDLGMYARFYKRMRQAGVYIAPSQFEVLFVSAAHTTQHINSTLKTAQTVLSGLRRADGPRP